MSLQKCHCGWSKVTTYQGLRTHQEKMGCMPGGQKDEECGQQNVGGVADYQKDTPIKKVDSSSDVGLQRCHCGWSKVTTYQDLRIHKGKMGCMPMGQKDEECGQQKVGGVADCQKDIPIKKDKILWECFCGWSEVTTYQGLRIHQGEMGCTPKGLRIPKEDQWYWKKRFEEMNQRKHEPANMKQPVKVQREPLSPRPNSPTTAAEITGKIKPEYKPLPPPPPRSSQTGTIPKLSRQPQDSSTGVEGNFEADLLAISNVFSEVRIDEDSGRMSQDRPYSLTTTTSTALAATELERISNFAVDVKLDPSTAYECLVSADGKRLSSRGGTRRRSGSILGLNRLTSGKSYWEVVVSNKTGWSLGVATGDAQRKGKVLLCPDNGYWVAEHFKNKFAALTNPPVGLPLKEKPQKVGVFLDYEEGLVSFYDVTAQSHIYSFTECAFTEGIYPYFILHVIEDGSTDPLIISTVKRE